MDDVVALALVAAVVIATAGMCWLAWRSGRRARTNILAASERFMQRLTSPDLDALERHVGHALPASFRALYNDHKLIMSDDLLVGIANPIEDDSECFVAWFYPGDMENLDRASPESDGLFPFANNGSGDQFLVALSQVDPEVIYHSHQSGERRGLGVTLSAFLAAPRRTAPDA